MPSCPDPASQDAPLSDALLRDALTDLHERGPCGIIITRPDGQMVHANATFLAWTGRTAEDVAAGLRLQDLLPVAGRLFYETRYAPLLQMQGAVNEVTFDLLRKDGSRLPVLVNSVRRVDATGQPVLVASTVFDATQRRQYEEELLRARQRVEQLAAIVTHSTDAIISASADGVVESWNDAAETLFGYAAADGVGRNVRDLFVASRSADAYVQIVDQLRRGQAVHLDTQVRHADGRLIDVSVGITPHTGLLGELSSISFIIRDISERRAIERMRDELVAIVSHDLRSPLTFIVGVADLLQQRGVDGPEHTRLVATLASEARRLAALVDDFLDIQRMEAGAMRVEPVRLDPRPVLERAVQAAQLSAAHPVVLDIEDAAPVLADAQHLQQVVTNLLSNAQKYAPEGGEIHLTARARGALVTFAVRDRGLGIPEEALPRLFEKFYRVQARDRRNIVGTGLGLAICRRIVEAYGGTIRAESDGPGRGATFTFTLPAAPDA